MPLDKNLRRGKNPQGKEHTMQLVLFVLSIIPDTRCSRILELKEENVVHHHQAWTINESYVADPHLATALEGSLVGNRGKQLHSEVVKYGRAPHYYLEPQGGYLSIFCKLQDAVAGKPCFRRPKFM